jgi:hypothetical protein
MSKVGAYINKNANNKVDVLYKNWLGRRFVERELFHKTSNAANIEKIRDLLCR